MSICLVEDKQSYGSLGERTENGRPKMLKADDFPINTLSYEVRHEPAYLIWDRAGELWNTLLSQEPELRVRISQPNQQILETAELQITIEPMLFRVNSRGPQAFKSLIRVGELLTTTATNLFKINSFTRSGYRCIRRKVFATREVALASVADVVPPFSDNGDMKRVGLTWSNRLEGDVKGLIATITVDQQEIQPIIPWEWRERVTGEKATEAAVILDADYYTVGLTDRAAFNAEDWLKAANRFVGNFWSGLQQ